MRPLVIPDSIRNPEYNSEEGFLDSRVMARFSIRLNM